MSVNPNMPKVCFTTGHLDVLAVVVVRKLKMSSPESLLLSLLWCASGERFRSCDLSKRPCCFYLWCSVWRSQQRVFGCLVSGRPLRIVSLVQITSTTKTALFLSSSFLHFLCKHSDPNPENVQVLISIQDPCFSQGHTQGLSSVTESELIHILLVCWWTSLMPSYRPFPRDQALRKMHFQRHKLQQWERHCSALAAQLLRQKNQ